MTARSAFDAYADLLTYPGASGASGLPAAEGDAAAAIGRFASATGPLSPGELEELYTRTFDINPVSSLEVGWHLYGEQYERGAFLVKMRELLRAHGVPETAELPDHLTHLLRLVGTMEREEAQAFSAAYLVPAVSKMLEGFAGAANPYGDVMTALKHSLDHAFISEGTCHG